MMKEKRLDEKNLTRAESIIHIKKVNKERTGLHRLSEYTDGMLDIIDKIMINRKKQGRIEEEVEANARAASELV